MSNPPLSKQAQELYETLEKKTIKNSYYDDERDVPILTPDLNKAYDLISDLLNDPPTLAELLKEPIHPPKLPHIQTTMEYTVKCALAGDFDSQLSKESDYEKNKNLFQRLVEETQKNSHLFSSRFWEEPTPLVIQTGQNKTIIYPTQDSPLPEDVSRCLEGEAWSVHQTCRTPLLRTACHRLFGPLAEWSWSGASYTPPNLPELYHLAQTLASFQSFPSEMNQILKTNPTQNTSLFQSYSQKVLNTPLPLKEILSFISSNYSKNPDKETLLLHLLTQKTNNPDLQTALETEKSRRKTLKESVKSQDFPAL